VLEKMGAKVQYHDPFIAQIQEDSTVLRSVPLTAETLRGADCVVIVTDHTGLDYAMIARETRALVDTRHVIADRLRAGKR